MYLLEIVLKLWAQIELGCFTKNEPPEAVAQRCSVKTVFLEISQNSQNNTCVSGLQPYLKRDPGTCAFL